MAEQAGLGFAGLLRRLRDDAGLTQEELAEAAQVSQRAVSDLERGINRTARKDTALLLAGALGLDGQAGELFVAAARGKAPAWQVLTVYQLGSVPGLPVSLPPRQALLVGREELLAGLESRLGGGDGRGPRIVVLSGLGGAGKTSVAVEYAHRHLAGVGLAWQFPAEDREVLVAEFARLAAQLGAWEAARAHLARWTGEAGDAAAARDQLAALVPVRERVSGREHPATLAARASLASWTRQAGGDAECAVD